ncbi:MAG: FtsX-like permease family protein [Myxococcota bacterium]
MSLRFTLAMARRESRATRRRLVLYMGSVAVGVAALVAISSFRSSVSITVHAQSRTLLGADLQLSSRAPFDDEGRTLIAAIERLGRPAAYVTRFSSMALAESSGRTRMVYVQAVSGAYPYYGEIRTEPAGHWESFRSARQALVDPAALIQLDMSVGETITIGDTRFTIVGTIAKAPGDVGMRNAIAPRVYIPATYLDETRLLRTGSLVVYSAYFKVADAQALETLLAQHQDLLRAKRIRAQTVEEYGADLSEDLGRLASFLGLVGLIALLLGGVGVASGVHVFATEKLDTAAVLRCLGARQGEVFAIYLVQAGALGLLGSLLGALLGVGVQAALPAVVRDFLPVDVPFRLDLGAILTGLVLGLWVALLFALLPLLKIKGVAPLRALRRDFETGASPRDPWRLAAIGAMVASLLAVSVWQAPTLLVGLWFAGGLAASMTVLSLAAAALTWATRRFFPRRAPYWVRQGVANLFRPQNQTLAVTLALGLGVFLIAALHVVQGNLLYQLNVDRGPDRPNLALFDIQLDQQPGVVGLLEERGARVLEQTPIVPARIARIGNASVDSLLARSSRDRSRRWALRREYRLTYREQKRESEHVTAGRWWKGEAPRTDGVHRISLEEDLASDLGVEVGDRITWDIQGVPVETEITNLRTVEWARFETNFFAVFEPGPLERAPQSIVVIARMDDPEDRALVQRDLVARFPNISVLDATVMLEAIDAVLEKVAFAIRFMALFAIVSGLVILVGTISTSRYQRARESVLLRTLGAQARTVRRILATEYFALGTLSGLVGVVLACGAAWALMRFLFQQSAALPWADLILICIAVGLASACIGLFHSRDTLRRTPLAGLREVAGPQ